MVRSVTKTVTVTKVSSELTIGLSRSEGPPGDISILGSLFKGGTIVVIPGATVELYVNGIYTGSTITNSSGRYLFTASFEEGSYDIYTRWDGNDTYWQDTSPVVYAEYAKIGTGISINVSPTSGAPPLTVTIMGQLTSDDTGWGLNGKTAHLYRDDEEIDSMTTASTSGGPGFYIFTDVIEMPGNHTYYVEFLGDDEYAGCEEGESLPCTMCGYPIPSAILGSEVECQSCHSVFDAVIM